jgi:hypothetical protein
MHETFEKLAEPRETSEQTSSGLEQHASGERDGDPGNRTGRREYRVAVINTKGFSAFPIATLYMGGQLPEIIFMPETVVESILVIARHVHPDTMINKKDTLYLKGIAPGYVKSLGSIEISLKGHQLSWMWSPMTSIFHRKVS